MDNPWSGYIDDDYEEFEGTLLQYYMEHPDETVEDCFSYLNDAGTIAYRTDYTDIIRVFTTSWAPDFYFPNQKTEKIKGGDEDLLPSPQENMIPALEILDQLIRDGHFHRVNCAECMFNEVCEKMQEPRPDWDDEIEDTDEE